MSTVADYVGRKVDLVAFDGEEDAIQTERLLSQSLVKTGESGAILTGIQKLVQRFLFVLLTERGSLQYLPLLGCDMIRDGRTGQWRSTADVTQSFYSAVLDVQRQLGDEELATDPLDERFGGAKLTGVTLTKDSVRINVSLSSLAGNTRQFITPILTVLH
jgi:hypothetical protein